MKGTNQLDKVKTPQDILDRFKGYFDPCPTDPKFDGLAIRWKPRNFVNPPYRYKIKWIAKAIYESILGNDIVMLLPATTDTPWFHDLILPYSDHIEYLRGRLPFKEIRPRTGSMLVYFKGKEF